MKRITAGLIATIFFLVILGSAGDLFAQPRSISRTLTTSIYVMPKATLEIGRTSGHGSGRSVFLDSSDLGKDVTIARGLYNGEEAMIVTKVCE